MRQSIPYSQFGQFGVGLPTSMPAPPSAALKTLSQAAAFYTQINGLLAGAVVPTPVGGITPPLPANITAAATYAATNILPLAAAMSTVAGSLPISSTTPPPQIASFTTAAANVATVIGQIQAAPPTVSPAGVSQMVLNAGVLSTAATQLAALYFAQNIVSNGCPVANADAANFQAAYTTAGYAPALPATGIYDAATQAAVNVVAPGTALSCLTALPTLPGPGGGIIPINQPPVPPVVVVAPVAVPAAQSTTTTVIEVIGAIAGVASIAGLIYAMNRGPLKNPLRESFGPEDDDYEIQDSRYGGYDVHVGGRKGSAHYPSMDAALSYIRAHMEREQFWPDIYYVNDHGNIDLIDVDGNIIESRV
jgi:hypothetical protein